MKNKIIKKDNLVGLKGRYKFTLANIVTPEQKRLMIRIERLREAGQDFVKEIKKLNSICDCEISYRDNLVTTVGMAMITNNLTSSSPTDDPQINYCAVGTGVTTPALSDTTLETETYRNLQASQTNSGSVAYVTMFISATDDNGTYKEVGFFANGTASADSGVLFSHSAINITKSALQTLTIDYTLTLANS